MSMIIRATEAGQENYMPHQRFFWIRTRARRLVCCNNAIDLSGLVGYNEGTGLDFGLFLIVIFMELYGLSVLLNADLKFVYAASLFAIDLILAIFLHWPVGNINVTKRYIRLYDDFDPSVPWPLPRQTLFLAILTWIRRFIMALILLVAAVKVFTLYARLGTFDAQVLLVCITYLIVGVLHITVTGYFFAGIITELIDIMEHWNYGNHRTGPLAIQMPPQPFERSIRLRTPSSLMWTVIGRHIVVRSGIISDYLLRKGDIVAALLDGDALSTLINLNTSDHAAIEHALLQVSSPFVPIDGEHPGGVDYKLFTWGILTDNQILDISHTLNAGDCTFIIAQAIIHQMVTIMNLTPYNA